MTKSPGLLLDTHAWFWLMSETGEFSSDVKEQIEQATQRHQVYISAISIWEVGMLSAKKRIQLQQDVLQWVQTALKAPGTQLVPLLPEIAIESTRLPGKFHGDPADRLIVATARHTGVALLTRDEKIIAYGRQGYLNIIAI